MNGIITKGIGGAYTVSAGSVAFTCTARGVFRNRGETPLVGDMVTISVTDTEKKLGTITHLHPRKNQLRRPPAANISQVIITVSTTQPDFHAGLLDRFLVLIEHEEIPILICVNKIDLNDSFWDVFEIYSRAGYPLVYAGALDGTGLDELRTAMAGKVNLFAGASGVGKSSLINALAGTKLETGEISTKLKRGKHTTRHTEIFPLGASDADGFCFDTPGFTSLDITHIQKNELAHLFREFRPFLQDCRFKNCRHIHEKDCGVKAEVGRGIHPARYESYVQLYHLSD